MPYPSWRQKNGPGPLEELQLRGSFPDPQTTCQGATLQEGPEPINFLPGWGMNTTTPWMGFLGFFALFRAVPQYMEIPRLGVELELQLQAYDTATATLDPSCICSLCCSLQQCQILNPLNHNGNSLFLIF